MMKIHIAVSLEELDLLKESHKFFGFSDGTVLSGSQLVSWAVRMVVAAHDEAK